MLSFKLKCQNKIGCEENKNIITQPKYKKILLDRDNMGNVNSKLQYVNEFCKGEGVAKWVNSEAKRVYWGWGVRDD